MLFGIIANRKRPGADAVVKRVIAWTTQHGHDYRLCDDLRDIAPDGAKILPRNQLIKTSDLIVSMGGDGTLLASAREVAAAGIPIFGVNLGSLGFLTQVAADEVEDRLQDVVDGKHQLQQRMLIESSVKGDEANQRYYAMNDIVVDRGSLARLIQLDLYVNDEFITTFRADGLVICTPTGSTAYNAAVGGPILNPTMEAIVVSPLAPQSLAARPLLFGSGDVLRVRLSSPHHQCLMTVDGQIAVQLKNSAQVTIRRAPHFTRLVTFPHGSFYKILRTKLHWAVLPHSENT